MGARRIPSEEMHKCSLQFLEVNEEEDVFTNATYGDVVCKQQNGAKETDIVMPLRILFAVHLSIA